MLFYNCRLGIFVERGGHYMQVIAKAGFTVSTSVSVVV